MLASPASRHLRPLKHRSAQPVHTRRWPSVLPQPPHPNLAANTFQRFLSSAPQDTHGWFDHCGSQPGPLGCEEQDSRSFLLTRVVYCFYVQEGNRRNKEGSYV